MLKWRGTMAEEEMRIVYTLATVEKQEDNAYEWHMFISLTS